jgi:ClpP class serine protease
MNLGLASVLLRSSWAIDPVFAINSLSLVSDILAGRVEVDPDLSATHIRQGDVAVISIKGPLMKDDRACGPMGMANIGRLIKSYDAAPDISAIVLSIDSPGGTVDGTDILSRIVAESQKPVVAFIDGLAASAALWIAAGANEIFANSPMAEVGSVGVLLSFADFQPAYERQGVRFHTVTSDLSPDKVKLYEDLRAGKYDDYKNAKLNPLALQFQQWIRDNRPQVSDDHLTGKVYFAKDVMGVFVDSIGSLDQAISRAAALGASVNNSHAATSVKPNIHAMKSFPKLMALLAISALVVDEGASSLNEDQLQAIEDALAKANAPVSTADSDLEISSRDLRIAALEKDLADLRGLPAEKPAAAITSSDPGASDDGPTVRDDDSLIDGIAKIKREFGLA